MIYPLSHRIFFIIVRRWVESLWVASFLEGLVVLKFYFSSKLKTFSLLRDIMFAYGEFLVYDLFKLIWLNVWFHSVSSHSVRLINLKWIFVLRRMFLGRLLWNKYNIVLSKLTIFFSYTLIFALTLMLGFRFVRAYWRSPSEILLLSFYSFHTYFMFRTVTKAVGLAVKLAYDDLVSTPARNFPQSVLFCC